MAADRYLGQSVLRVEDPALLRGAGRFVDDLPVSARTAHAAVVRSPHAHARVLAVHVDTALALEGVHTILTGSDVHAWAEPFLVGVRQPMSHWPLAVDRVRYCGEPVAVVVADDRYLAEDAAERVVVDYEPLPVVVDPCAAARDDAPVLHEKVGRNVVSDRSFCYGEPDAQFANAEHIVRLTTHYPRNACTPMECIALVAEYLGETAGYDVVSNFQGPFSLQPVMARALRVDGARLRLRSASDSGGSFGVKQAAFPYIVAMCLAARKAARPVKWVEDRLEHLQAATSATNRVTQIEAAVTHDARVLALRYDQLDDCGAYLRAPEPASLYRTHGHMSGAYAIEHLAVRNRVVLTNKTPSGLNRGFGGPQLYYPLERLMQRIAVELAMDPLAVIRRNLVPANAMPYRAAAGALLDSGNYLQAVDEAVVRGELRSLRGRRDQARREGRCYGIGFAAVVEPSISNMGYITTVLSADERERAGPKNGGTATATVSIDPSGGVSAQVSSLPQGQGHRTVVAQVVADALGVAMQRVTVHVEHDTARDPWTISSGNYSSRFAGAVAGAVHRAACVVARQLCEIASRELNVPVDALTLSNARVHAIDNPDNGLSLRRVAGLAHWSPGQLPAGHTPAIRETVFWTPEPLHAPDSADRVNSSAAYGFIFDYCGVDIDRITGRVTVDRYVTMHDAGNLLNPAMVDGQIRGGFAHGIGAALYEAYHYGQDGSFLSGTFADYLVPSACEVPDPIILHHCCPSPFTPLGAKGVGEGNCMSTPVCLANAVADALAIDDVSLPMTPPRVAEWLSRTGPDMGLSVLALGDDALHGNGQLELSLSTQQLWHALVDPVMLKEVLPGCTRLDPLANHQFIAELALGVGPVRGHFAANVRLHNIKPQRSMSLTGEVNGPLGASHGTATLDLTPRGDSVYVRYDYRFKVSGKVASVGARMLEGAARAVVNQFLKRLAKVAAANGNGKAM